MHLDLPSNIFDMKKTKKGAESFRKLDATQMRKIDGGIWVEIRNPDGTITIVEL